MRRAVVLGGGIAGLLAARVLSDHAEDVAIVEPDDLGSAGGERAGAPQMKQLHALLDKGRTEMERWWPGISKEMIAGGAVLAQGDSANHVYINGVRKVAVPGNEMLCATRGFLERHIRRRALSRDTIRVVQGRATGLLYQGDRVIGARYAPAGTVGDEVDLPADLVVDATGRSTRLAHWLQEGGWQPPRLERMHIDLGYATALLRRGDELPGVTVSQSWVLPGPPGTKQLPAAAMTEVEGGRWMVVVAGYADQRPGSDPEAFLQACRDTPAPPFHELADSCPLLSEVTPYRMADSRRRHFTSLNRFPAGLIVVGDGVASFNPVYGQGMTSAALHASCLSSYLRSGASLDEPAWGYFTLVRSVVDVAWQLSTFADLAQPHVTGPYPRGYRVGRWVSDRIVEVSMTDAEVHRIFLDVVHMRAHPRLLNQPSTLLKVARALRRQRSAARASAH